MDADRQALVAALRQQQPYQLQPEFPAAIDTQEQPQSNRVTDWLSGQFSLDPQDQDFLSAETAGDLALGFVPGLNLPIAARDFERARRGDDYLGMGLAAASVLPFGKLAGALRKSEIIAGEQARHAPRADMAEGRWALNRGENPEKVWWDRGVFQGTEEHAPMKWEIPDQAAKIKHTGANFEGKLSDYLDHPEFFKNYPEAKDWYLLAEKGPNVNPEGFFHATADSGFPAINVFAKDDKELMATLLHEIQHGVQHLEKFDPGTNVEEIRQALVKQLRAKENGVPDTALYRSLRDKAGAMYERNAGEVEARNVELRRRNSPQFNRSTAPFMTQPIPPELTLLESELPHMVKSGVSASEPISNISRMSDALRKLEQLHENVKDVPLSGSASILDPKSQAIYNIKEALRGIQGSAEQQLIGSTKFPQLPSWEKQSGKIADRIEKLLQEFESTNK